MVRAVWGMIGESMLYLRARWDPGLCDAVTRASAAFGISRSEYIRRAIEMALRNDGVAVCLVRRIRGRKPVVSMGLREKVSQQAEGLPEVKGG